MVATPDSEYLYVYDYSANQAKISTRKKQVMQIYDQTSYKKFNNFAITMRSVGNVLCLGNINAVKFLDPSNGKELKEYHYQCIRAVQFNESETLLFSTSIEEHTPRRRYLKASKLDG